MEYCCSPVEGGNRAARVNCLRSCGEKGAGETQGTLHTAPTDGGLSASHFVRLRPPQVLWLFGAFLTFLGGGGSRENLRPALTQSPLLPHGVLVLEGMAGQLPCVV